MAYRPQPGQQRPPGPPGPPMQQPYGGPRPMQPPSPQQFAQRPGPPPMGGYPPRSPPGAPMRAPYGGPPGPQQPGYNPPPPNNPADYFGQEEHDRAGLLANRGYAGQGAYSPGGNHPLEKHPDYQINMDERMAQQQRSDKRRSYRHVELKDGNLVLDCPVPDKLLRNVKYTTGEEFTLMRYTAATCDPNDFLKNRYTLRPRLLGRHTELFIVMTMYNEDDVLFLKTMNAVTKNIAHLCSRTKSKTWGPEGWQKIVVCLVSDGRKKINARVLKVLGAMGVYQDGIAKTQVGDKDVTAHIYEYTTQVQVDQSMRLHGADKGVVPVQMIFCLKEQNKKKLNSHRWFFNAFAQQLNPHVCVLLDVGTKPSGTSLYHLWKAFDRNPNVGGACGEICAELGNGWSNLLNPLVASQNFEYKMSNILDKPLESVFGYISVLPGAFSAYRYKALKDISPGKGPLASYFKGETLHGAGAGIFEANMYLAEDRILCFELVAKRNEAWLLKYVKSAKAETDVPDSLDEFISQRRRWLNGSFFAAIFGTVHFYRIWESGHNIFRKSFLMLEFLYNAINLAFNWFALGNFYLTFFFLTKASLPATYQTTIGGQTVTVTQSAPANISDPFFGMGEHIFSPLRELYIGVIIIIFISSLGNRPQGSKFVYWLCVFLFALIMLIMLYVSGFTIYQTVPKTFAGWKNAVTLFQSSPAFRDIIISLGSTYVLYFLSSFLYGEPWHMFTSFLQYLFLLPAYVNILMVYAFCNTHDVSWGTKGDNKVESLGAAAPVKGKDGQTLVQVEVPTERADINAAYDQFLRDLAVPEEKKKGHRDAATKQEDYYKLFRTRLVLTWMFSNALLIIIMTSDVFLQWIMSNNPNSQKSYNPYLTFIFWSVAGLSAIRFIGSTSYLILRLILG